MENVSAQRWKDLFDAEFDLFLPVITTLASTDPFPQLKM